ncbi:MAG: 4Fe-4S dicluster domain-containing protein [Syntrophobacterales bacterium]|nr:4Fe-4S dicluster domain-containing protein [Syntrophobacterales bacterium]
MGSSLRIFLRPERCINCYACEVACEKTHEGMGNIKVQGVPLVCLHCEVPPCITSCYRGALEIKEGIVVIRKDYCTNCGICVLSCPFGAIMVTEVERDGKKIPRIHKCDGCWERPYGFAVCALTCPSGAIGWERFEDAVVSKREKVYRLYLRG